MFDLVRFDIHAADSWATELHRGSSLTQSGASHLLMLCQKANASCQAFERVMAGVLPPKSGT